MSGICLTTVDNLVCIPEQQLDGCMNVFDRSGVECAYFFYLALILPQCTRHKQKMVVYLGFDVGNLRVID